VLSSHQANRFQEPVAAGTGGFRAARQEGQPAPDHWLRGWTGIGFETGIDDRRNACQLSRVVRASASRLRKSSGGHGQPGEADGDALSREADGGRACSPPARANGIFLQPADGVSQA
jgi:hypothetical protein